MDQNQTRLESKAIAIKAIPILIAVSIIYSQDLAVVFKEALTNEMMSHIIAVPFLFSYLLYRKRKILRIAVSFPKLVKNNSIQIQEAIGVLLCITAFILYWHGSYAFNPLEYRIASLPIFITGVVLATFNLDMFKALAFPILFLIFMTPPPLELFNSFGVYLSILSSDIAYNFLKIIGLPVELITEYGVPTIVVVLQSGTRIPFAVDLACSGMYSLTGFLIFSAFIAYVSQGKLWKKVLVFIIGFPLIYLLNVVRITSIILLGYYYGLEIATQAFHLMGGLALTFIGTLVLLVILEKVFKLQIFTFKGTKSNHTCDVYNEDNKEVFCIECGKILKNSWQKITRRDVLKALLLIFFASLTILIQVPTFALVKGPEDLTLEAGSEKNLERIFPDIPGYSLYYVYRDAEFEKLAKQDASLVFLYNPQNKSDLVVLIGLEIAETISSLHRWEVCLISWPESHGRQVQVITLDQRDVILLDNPPIRGRYLAVQWKETEEVQVILYFYETLIFRVGSGYQTKNVKISIVAYGYDPEEYYEIEEKLLIFGKTIAENLQPVKLWSTFALSTAQYGPHLLGISTTSLIMLVTLQTRSDHDRRKKNLNIYRKLSKEEQLVINTIKQTSEPTLANIAVKYKEMNGEPMGNSNLLKKLTEAEEIGLIKVGLINRCDEPVLVFKSEVL